jgi:outer membrane biogenesis lipoprotein LolB
MRDMMRPLDNRVWLLLLALAIAVIAACSSTTTTGPTGDDGPTEDSPAAATGG